MIASTSLPALPKHSDAVPALREPLPVWVRRGLLGLVVGLHIVGGWALSRVQAARLIVGEVAPMEVRMVLAETPAPQVDPDLPLPDEPPPVDLQPPPPEMPKLETQLDPPPPDLPPPVFPVAASPPPPPPPPKPQIKPPPRPPVPVEAAPQPAAPQAPAAPRTVTASQVQYLDAPPPPYPNRSRRANEQGTVVVRVLVDIAGRATQVSLLTSSRYPALDDAALTAVRGWRFRPFVEGGVAQAIWVNIPVTFELK